MSKEKACILCNVVASLLASICKYSSISKLLSVHYYLEA